MTVSQARAEDLDNIQTGFVELRLTTCDVKDAGTNDDVFVDLNFVDVDKNGKRTRAKTSYELDNPGDDRGQGDVDRYVFPGFGRLRRLDSIQLRKQGSDTWCLSGMELRVNGQGIAMSYSGAHIGDDYVGVHHETPSRIWINADRKDAQALSINFSDTQSVTSVKVVDGLGSVTMPTLPNPAFLTIKPLLGVDSDKQITVVWRHDGVQGDRIRFPSPKGEPVSVYLGSDVDVIESLELQMSTEGKGGFSTEEINITGLQPFAHSWLHDTEVDGLGNWGENPSDRLPLITKPVNARANRAPVDHGFVHLPLRREGDFKHMNALLGGTPEYAVCLPPAKIDNIELQRLIATKVKGMWKDSCEGKVECSWGEHKVTISRVNDAKLYVHVQFRLTVTGPKDREYHIHPELTFNLAPECSDEDELAFNAFNVAVDLNIPPVVDEVVDLVRAFSKKLDKKLDAIESISIAPIDSGAKCPNSTMVNTDGSISFDWPEAKVPSLGWHIPNYMCRDPE